MDVLNLGLLILIMLFSIANLVIEINDNVTRHYELLYRLLFGSIAVGALGCILYHKEVLFYSFCILIVLVARYISKKEHNITH